MKPQRFLLFVMATGLLTPVPGRAVKLVDGPQQGVWRAADGPFVCNTSDIQVVAGTTLSIEPGAVVQFGSSRSMAVYGTLTKTDTRTTPITFTSTSATPQPGAWKQLQFGNGAMVALDHVNVQWAGGGSSPSLLISSSSSAVSVNLANVSVSNGAAFGYQISTTASGGNAVTLQNCSATACLGGLDISSASAADNIQILGNDFSGVTGAAVRVKPSALTAFSDSAARFSGNLPGDAFSMVDSQTFSKDVTLWHDLTVMPGSGGFTNIQPGVTVTVKPGVTFRFSDGQQLKVSGNLIASGQANAPASFLPASSSPSAGQWDGIRLAAGAKANLAYVNVGYAGEDGDAAMQANGADLTVTNSEVHDNKAHAIAFTAVSGDTAAHTLTVRDTRIHDNTTGDQTVNASGIRISNANTNDKAVITGNTFANNDRDISSAAEAVGIFNAGPGVVAGNSPSDTLSLDAGAFPDGATLWEKAIGQGTLTVPQGSSVTIQRGSGIRFAGMSFLFVSGTLNVAGQPGQIVWFDSTDGAPGGWPGIQFAPGSSGTLTGAVIAHAGATGASGLTVDGANVTVSGCGIVNNAGPGINLVHTVTFTLKQSLVSGNAGPGVSDTALGPRTIGNAAVDGNDIQGNDTASGYGIRATNDWDEALYNFWGDGSGPFHPTLNPAGKGSQVSDHVHFDPFSSSPLTTPLAHLNPITVPIQGNTLVTGIASALLLDHWTLEYGPGDPPAAYLPLATGTANIASGTLTTWNTTSLPHVRYSVRLTVVDVLGRSSQDVVVTRSPYGDITGNGLVEVADAVQALRFADGLGTPSATQLDAGDVRPKPTPDLKITTADAIAILQTAAGLYGVLP